ncbi:MAG: hypothetical protein QOI57_3408 [Rubrobacteraceae bacterium]|jgi:hypothetical protein|nr:hypothetical protein [Rubrobacteraceae bacterium]
MHRHVLSAVLADQPQQYERLGLVQDHIAVWEQDG